MKNKWIDIKLNQPTYGLNVLILRKQHHGDNAKNVVV